VARCDAFRCSVAGTIDMSGPTSAPSLAMDRTLLLGIVHPAPAAGERARLAAALTTLVDGGLSAGDVVSTLASHGLVPLAYRHFVAGDSALPPSLHAELSVEFRRHACSRFYFARSLRAILNVLDARGIAARPFKGPALAIQLYGNFAMRQYGDLDVLVMPSQMDAAVDALAAEGLVECPPPLDPAQERYLRRTRHSLELRLADGNTLVEMHWAVADRFHGVDLDVGWLMQEPQTIDLLGRRTLAIGGDRLLLALCLHGAKHLWERLIWLAEIAALIQTDRSIDWARAFRIADRIDLGRSFRACLLLVREHFGVAPPPLWSRALDVDPDAHRLASALDARLCAPDAGRDRLRERFRLGWLARASLSRRLVFGWRVATQLSERDLRQDAAPPASALRRGLERGGRLVRAAVAERRVRR
jgi:hypothetical protein